MSEDRGSRKEKLDIMYESLNKSNQLIKDLFLVMGRYEDDYSNSSFTYIQELYCEMIDNIQGCILEGFDYISYELYIEAEQKNKNNRSKITKALVLDNLIAL